MDIINQKPISKIDEENKRLKLENITLMNTIAALKIESNKKDMIATNLMKQIAELRISVMQIKGGK